LGFTQDSEKQKTKKIKEQQELAKGMLKILAVRARNLRADDGKTSDPYCTFNFTCSDNKKISAKTKYIKKTLNPE